MATSQQKTFDTQSGKFVATIIESIGPFHADIMQGWIQNPKTLKERLRRVLNPTFGVAPMNIVCVDRNKPLNAHALLANIGQEGGWSENGGDMRAPRVLHFDLDMVILGHSQRDYISLDAHAFRAIWDLRFLLTPRWKTRIGGDAGVITFSGTSFTGSGGLAVLGLSWTSGTGTKRSMDDWTARLYTHTELEVLGNRVSGAFVPEILV